MKDSRLARTLRRCFWATGQAPLAAVLAGFLLLGLSGTKGLRAQSLPEKGPIQVAFFEVYSSGGSNSFDELLRRTQATGTLSRQAYEYLRRPTAPLNRKTALANALVFNAAAPEQPAQSFVDFLRQDNPQADFTDTAAVARLAGPEGRVLLAYLSALGKPAAPERYFFLLRPGDFQANFTAHLLMAFVRAQRYYHLARQADGNAEADQNPAQNKAPKDRTSAQSAPVPPAQEEAPPSNRCRIRQSFTAVFNDTDLTEDRPRPAAMDRILQHLDGFPACEEEPAR